MEEYSSSGLTASQIEAITYAFLVPFVLVCVVIIIASWKLYTKAGKPGWAAIIPVYSTIVWLRIIGKPTWWTVFFMLPIVYSYSLGQRLYQPVWLIILFLIVIVNTVFSVWITNLLGKSFGQKLGFTFGLVLLPFVFYPILAFGNYQYLGPAGLKVKDGNVVPSAA
jgi:hypothetical protein